ncbi:hypothetical protein MPER_05594 [Moniliophthora perniciosa FA553]|nr:hypothetical protein MPER_05594 [Moniliophthora perniciosa FA553]
MTEDEQVIDVLQYMKRNYRLSLPKVVSRVFNSDNEILVNFCTHFCEDPDSLITLLEKVYAQSNGFDAINSFLEKHALEVVVAAVDSEFKKAQPLVQRASEKIDLEFLRTWSPSRLVQSLDMPNTKSLIAKMTTGRSTDENKLKDNQVVRIYFIFNLIRYLALFRISTATRYAHTPDDAWSLESIELSSARDWTIHMGHWCLETDY